MAKIIEFPSLEQMMVEQSSPAISNAINVIIDDARRHLRTHFTDLLKKYGAEKIVPVWASFMLHYMAKISYEATIQSLGSEEKYFQIMEELSRKSN